MIKRKQKGKAPKDIRTAAYDPGHKVKNFVTVIVRCWAIRINFVFGF